ncbi:MAG: PASTA domain-containing protein [Ruminococcus sp.]|nr:PASTA domain-containing protein [Ruminococcus sp.]
MKLCLGCMSQYDDNKIVCPICGYEEGAAPENALHIRPGTILKERYVVGKAIGYGGFGVTYIGWDALLQTKIAIKEYLPSEFSTRVVGQTQVTVFSGDKQEQFADGKDKFIEEARKLAKFHSLPGIVKIFDSFEENNTAYIIMELLEGETLADLLKRENKLSYERAIEMMTPVLESLSEVHRQGIIHRDIAPDNIFVTKNGDVKLIDFGAARYATTTHSRSLTVIIKPGYSPEEQYRSRGDQGTHTDVYASVATIYRMITGITPPDALERRAYYENRQKDLLEPVSKFCKEISADREAAIMNALNIRVEDRTADMDSFLNELNSESAVTRKAGKIAKTDRLKWPLWAKIAIPLASAALITFTVLFATGIIGFKANIIKDIVIPEGQTRVPSVVSEEYKEGEISLSEAKLLMEVKGSVSSDKLDADLILSQDVTGGSIVQENTVVGVYISEGIRKQIVPNLSGMDTEEAVAQLEAIGFKVLTEEEYNDTIAEGFIISQSLDPETEVIDGSEIVLTVSKGRDPAKQIEEKDVTLPDFTGKKYTEVIKEAQALGLTVKVSERRYSRDFEKDTVMEQSPAAEKKIKSTTVVEIVVSLGYNKVQVPRVLFMEEESAVAQIRGRGLNESISYRPSENVAAGNVISQSPDEGTEVDPESVVNIVISTGPAAFAMPNVVDMSEADAKNTLSSKGLSVTVVYSKDNSKTAGNVISQSVAAGRDVVRGDPVTITVCTHDDTVSVPNVIGRQRSEAEKAITGAGLKAAVNEVSDSSTAKGVVISQNPSSGSLKKGDTVILNVSKGAEQTTVTTAKQTVPETTTQTAAKTTRQTTTTTTTNTTTTTTTTTASDSTVYPTSVSLDRSSLELDEGGTYQLTATVFPSNATDKSVTWASNDTSVATIANGKVTAKAAGNAKITVKTSNGKTASCLILVKTPATISLSGYVWEDLKHGKSEQVYDNRRGSDDIYLSGKEVQLINNRTKTTQYAYTDNVGLFSFNNVRVSELSECTIKFDYNGLVYTLVDSSKDFSESRRSRANEDTIRRKTLNSMGLNITSGKKEESIYNISSSITGDYISDYYDYLNNNGKGEPDSIEFLNIGICKREMPDTALVQDIYSVEIIDDGLKYDYVLKKISSGNDVKYGIQIKDENPLSEEYAWSLPFYKSELSTVSDKKLSEINVISAVGLANNSSSLYSKINSINVFYPDTMDLIEVYSSADDGPGELFKCSIVDVSNTSANSSLKGYSCKKITFSIPVNVDRGKTQEIYIKYKFKSSLSEMIDKELDFITYSEIGSYSLYSDEKYSVPYLGYDYDSTPNNFIAGIYEDDDDFDYGFKVLLKT